MRNILFALSLTTLLLSCGHNKPPSAGSKQDSTPVQSTGSRQITIDTVALAQVKADPYLDIALKGGDSIVFFYDSTDQYLLYKHAGKVMDTLSGCSMGLPYRNLGFLETDFTDYFVFGQAYGTGNPEMITLYEKKTCKELTEDGAAWIDADEAKELLLYSANDVPEAGDSMTLYDLKQGQKKNYPFPNDLFDEPEVLSRITLENVTAKSFTILYDVNAKEYRKIYAR